MNYKNYDPMTCSRLHFKQAGNHPPLPSWVMQILVFYNVSEKHTSIVFPLEAVTMSPGLMPVPLIIFSQAATIK